MLLTSIVLAFPLTVCVQAVIDAVVNKCLIAHRDRCPLDKTYEVQVVLLYRDCLMLVVLLTWQFFEVMYLVQAVQDED